MRRAKIDGVIEAVRYTTDGHIAVARSYERRGQVWSDLILLDRKQLLEQLECGRHFVTGKRKLYHGNEFEVGSPVYLKGESIATKETSSGRDILTGIPIF